MWSLGQTMAPGETHEVQAALCSKEHRSGTCSSRATSRSWRSLAAATATRSFDEVGRTCVEGDLSLTLLLISASVCGDIHTPMGVGMCVVCDV